MTTRRESKDRRSLLDRMEEIAEEQEAASEARRERRHSSSGNNNLQLPEGFVEEMLLYDDSEDDDDEVYHDDFISTSDAGGGGGGGATTGTASSLGGGGGDSSRELSLGDVMMDEEDEDDIMDRLAATASASSQQPLDPLYEDFDNASPSTNNKNNNNNNDRRGSTASAIGSAVGVRGRSSMSAADVAGSTVIPPAPILATSVSLGGVGGHPHRSQHPVHQHSFGQHMLNAAEIQGQSGAALAAAAAAAHGYNAPSSSPRSSFVRSHNTPNEESMTSVLTDSAHNAPTGGGGTGSRRTSFSLRHRNSFGSQQSQGSISMKSAPTLDTGGNALLPGGGGDDDEQEGGTGQGGRPSRRVTISGRPGTDGQAAAAGSDTTADIDYDYSTSAGGHSSLRHSKRRQNLYRPSIHSAGTDNMTTGSATTDDSIGDDRAASSRIKKLRNRTVFAPRRSTRRVVGSISVPPGVVAGGGSGRSIAGSRSGRDADGGGSSGGTSMTTMGIAAAADRLGSLDDNADWENTAAAAAIVAASAAPLNTNRSGKQFSQDDHVLVMLAILNITNHDDDKETFTIAPVNRFGYPEGEGKTESQKHGPYSFLLCTVTKVHFDEDERYYTVKRFDTGTEQRADPNWMEPIKDNEAAIEAALRAAKRTRLTEEEKNKNRATERRGPLKVLADSFREIISCLPAKNLKRHLVRKYAQIRKSTKALVQHILHGDHGFAFKMRITGINFLVLCSFIYLFIEVFSLAFLPARLDWAAAMVGLAVWIVLALELLFEYLIRPPDIHQLLNSEKAFAPSTARHISSYHLVFEALALALFIPQFHCIGHPQSCGADIFFSNVYASIHAVVGVNLAEAALGRFILGLTFLRIFGLVRHWKQMWLNHTFEGDTSNSRVLRHLLLVSPQKPGQFKKSMLHRDSRYIMDTDDSTVHLRESAGGGMAKHNLDKSIANSGGPGAPEDDQLLKNAANIGTALMIINSRRALVILLFIMVVFPMFYTIIDLNNFDSNLVDLLQANNIVAPSNSTQDCNYLQEAVEAWLRSASTMYTDSRHLLRDGGPQHLIWGQLLPVRCAWQSDDGVFTVCPSNWRASNNRYCGIWGDPVSPEVASPEYFADELGLRVGALQEFSLAASDVGSLPPGIEYSVRAIFDKSYTIATVNIALFLLLWSMILLVLIGLTVMRGDAGRLVLDPLRRMLKIVVRYAKNPLSPSRSGMRKSTMLKNGNSEELGNYETEQLINAIAKIADLLRKCWGVAGAGIISSNLAREGGKTAMFNPTVPGKRVYALFGFVGIKEFSKQLRSLDSDVMILINDVARVVHDDVYRWALGDTGQCNKNLGGAFLMVFRIGDWSEVAEKFKQSRDIVFSTGRKRRSKQFEDKTADALQLASLPGIQGFADRALLGFLKSFAAIHRDRKLQNWGEDFRLGAGVGAFTVSVLYGMDAGWAVEGAVGSEYKIDATYLSPHVNMASRMMSATKQYGVTILLSQAVEELLSTAARAKLRHLDTVYVKGSNVAQQIFTYDARYEGVDFFLFDRSAEQADREADNYSPAIWNEDQDLRSMRQHVTDDFMKAFHRGVDQYLEGEWKTAIGTLEKADNLMIEAVLEEGYIECDADEDEIFNRESDNEEIIRIRNEFGDGACKCLIQYMERRNCVPPRDWHGVRKLMSK